MIIFYSTSGDAGGAVVTLNALELDRGGGLDQALSSLNCVSLGKSLSLS
jgi:hypothetical protein